MSGSEASVLLADKYPFVYAAVGVHPDNADEVTPEAIERLRQLCKNEKVVAVGEIGLDYYWDNVDREMLKKLED